MKRYLTLLYVLLLVILSACNGKSSQKEENKRLIMVTMEPQRYFTEAIAGDKFLVESMVPKGSSPETYDPTPQQLTRLSKSEAYLRIGHIGFEQSWMDRLTDNAPHMQIFDTSKGVELIHGEGHNHGDHFHAGGVDPHIWNSISNARIIAKNTFQALITLDKTNENYYLHRYDSLCKVINRTDSVINNIFQTRKADHAFMIYHPALSYFARDYGLPQICIEEEGKEPSPAHLRDLIEICKEEEVRIIFVQPEFDRRNAEIIAKQTNTNIVDVNPLSYNWEKEMIHIANSLCK